MRYQQVIGITRFVSVIFAGIFGGFLVGVLVLELTLRTYDAHVYTQVRQVELVGLDDLASATLIPALVATTVLAALMAKARGRGFWLAVSAVALLVTAFVTSLLVNLPINSDQLGWSVQNPPADWASVRDNWQIAHVIRTTAATLAFGFLSAAAIVTPSIPTRKVQGTP